MIVVAAVLACICAVALLAGFAAILRVDQSWLRHMWQCCRCAAAWGPSVEKLCPEHGCGGRGRLARRRLIPPHRVPSHDWQGRLDTVPIPIVSSIPVVSAALVVSAPSREEVEAA